MNTENPTKAARRRYLSRFLFANLAYVLVLLGSVYYIKHGHPEGVLRYLLALLPLVPVAFMVPIFLDYLRQTDEFERRLQTDSLAIAAGITAMVSVTYGFLEIAGFPPVSAWWTWCVVMFSWGIARCFIGRLYE